MKLRINQAGVDLIKESEGFSAKPYHCPAGLLTIGYGTVIDTPDEEYLKDKVLTRAEAEALLRKELEYYDYQVQRLVRTRVNDNQHAALVSFAYNVGVKALQGSTLMRKITANPDDPTIVHEFMRWNKAAGKIMPGLTTRRKKEAELYFKK